MRSAVAILALAGSLWQAALAGAQGARTHVDLELILAVDVSRSMDLDEQQLQRDGYVAAIKHPDVIAAIGRGLNGKIALAYIEWAGPAAQFRVIDWRVIDGAAAGIAFSDALAVAPVQRMRGTSISDVLTYVAPLFGENAYEGIRQVIDVSGDGPNNMGIPIEEARERILAQGVTVNGLPIMIKRPSGFASIGDLDIYYEDCVIGGPGAFLIAVTSRDQFAAAIRRKLVLEIAGREPDFIPAGGAERLKRIDCLIGEKLRQQWLRE